MPSPVGFFKANVASNKSFYVVSAFSIVALLLALVATGYQFSLFGDTERDGEYYMNLSKGPLDGTCGAKPFSEHLPLEFTYHISTGDLSYKCMPPLFFQVICHLAVTITLVGLSLASYLFGILVVQRKAFVFLFGYILISICMIRVGITEIVISIGSNNFCKNELLSSVKFNSPTGIVPTSVSCYLTHYIVFGFYEVIVGIISVLHSIILSFFFINYFKLKQKQKEDEQKPYEDVKFDDKGHVVSVTDDVKPTTTGTVAVELPESNTAVEQPTVNDAITEHAVLAG
ncbi:hypothetical protein EIN_316580 [Entamoeba invadens IP1]|uniref:Uncharacterized protein n=1 Tax=Entamoeba invadens IP1 TaxID=370355 RepID=A0A0A1TZG3_ENTIV|nr:hypothetical protein EIN_316580 [Entamoeba invadens IP1]ELP86959.1 hypothetical protein EIN_316580 [Entamoeba invadens IP1]|eukprot:XP_004253730.1 hypothetical protein EIN_316580 [Entamoeba invadens IP1]